MYKIITLSALLFLSAFAAHNTEQKNQFPYIQPISVEVAPSETLQPTQEMTQEQKQLLEDEKIQEKIAHDTYQLKILFPHNKATLTKIQKQKIKELASYLQQHQDIQIIIYGYAEQNEKEPKLLATKRAQAVTKVLKTNGISFIRLSAIGTDITRADSFPTKDKDSQIKVLLIN